MALALSGAAACGGGGGGGGSPPDTDVPVVTATSPQNNAANVPVDSVIAVTFSEPIDPATLTAEAVSIRSGFNTRAGTISYSGTTATFTPNAVLDTGAMYTVHVSPGVTDAAGNALPVDYFWTFTTEPPPDTTAPTVVSTLPADGAVSVALDSAVTARFSEPVDSGSVTSATFLVGPEGGEPISGGVVSYDADSVTARFVLPPGRELVNNQRYAARITADVVDTAGNHLAGDYAWTFTAEPFPDTTPPQVVDSSPDPGDKRVPLGAVVSAKFNEAMAVASLNGSTFSVSPAGGNPIPGNIGYDGASLTATFSPSVPLVSGTTYTARLTTGVADEAGNALAAEYQWAFTIIAPRFAFVANADSDDVSVFSIDPPTGMLTLEGTVSAGDNPSALTVDPTGSFVFVANKSSNTVTAFRFDAANAALQQVGVAFTGLAPNSVAADPTGRFVYVTNMNSGNVSAFSVSPTGALVNVAPAQAATTPTAVAVHPSGLFAYVAHQSAGVWRFHVDGETGVLRDGQSEPAGRQPVSVAVDPSGRFTYVANRLSKEPTAFRVDQDTGLLARVGDQAQDGSGYVSVAVDPSGRFVYAASSPPLNTVSAFRIEQDGGNSGRLVFVGSAATGSGPSAVTVDPSGQFVYVTNGVSDDISVFRINQSTGALTQPVTAASAGGPTSIAVVGTSD